MSGLAEEEGEVQPERILPNPAPQQRHHDDLFFRPPLLRPPSSPDHDNLVRPMIYRMLIASNTLRMDAETRFTAIVLWHRYCDAVIPTYDNGDAATIFLCSDDAAWAAAACLFLASKVEEEPLRLRDIINVAHMYLRDYRLSSSAGVVQNNHNNKGGNSSEAATAATAEHSQDPTSMISGEYRQQNGDHLGAEHLSSKAPMCVIPVKSEPPRLDDEYWSTKEKIVRAEQIVLRWIAFDTCVSKPHRAIPIILEEGKLPITPGWHELGLSSEGIVPLAWKCLGDVLVDSAALQHSVLELACAAIGLAIEEFLVSRQTKTVNGGDLIKEEGEHWWTQFEVDDASYSATREALRRAKDGLTRACETNQKNGEGTN